MDLQKHARCNTCLFKGGVDTQHGHLDNVSGGALNGCIEGGTLGVFAGNAVIGKKFRQVAASSEKRGGVAFISSFSNDVIEVAFHTTKTLEIVFHDAFRLALRDTELLRKTKGRQTIHKTVGHGFDATS